MINYDGIEINKSCPLCDSMKLRITADDEGQPILACPVCGEHTGELPEDIKLELVGAEKLPGF